VTHANLNTARGDIFRQATSSASFVTGTPGASVEQRQLQPFDFKKRLAGNTLQVSIQSCRRFDDPANLFLLLCPKAHHRFAFSVEVGLHVRKALDHGLDAAPETWAGKVLIN